MLKEWVEADQLWTLDFFSAEHLFAYSPYKTNHRHEMKTGTDGHSTGPLADRVTKVIKQSGFHLSNLVHTRTAGVA